jgi:integrase
MSENTNQSIDTEFLNAYTKAVIQGVLSTMSQDQANLDSAISSLVLPQNEEMNMSNRIKRRVSVNGTDVWVTANTEQELIQKIFQLGQNTKQQPVGCPTAVKHNFEEFAQKWFETYNKPNIEAVSAITNERQLTRYIYPAFGHMNIEDITSTDVQKLFTSMGSTLARATKDKVKHVLNMIFDYALAEDIILKNPLASKSIRVTGKPEEKTPAYSVQEMQYFVQNIDRVKDQRDRTWFALMLFHPLRPEECLGLQYKNIIDTDTGQKIMRIWATVTHPDRCRPVYRERLKTEASRREIAVSPAALPYIGTGQPEDFVVGGKEPMSYTAVGHMRRRIARDIEYDGKITPRRFRTTVASDLYAVTKDEKLVQRMLGHAKYSTTAMNHYIEMRSDIDTAGTIMANLYSKTDGQKISM